MGLPIILWELIIFILWACNSISSVQCIKTKLQYIFLSMATLDESQTHIRLNVSTNLWASIHKEYSRVFSVRLQVVRLVYHPIKLEA